MEGSAARATGARTLTASVLFVDVVGSTELRARLGEERADQLFGAQRDRGRLRCPHAGDTAIQDVHLGASDARDPRLANPHGGFA